MVPLIEISRALLLGFTVGLTGTLVPRPMFFATIEISLKKGWIAGPEVVLGHMLVEFVLIVFIFLEVTSLLVKDIISPISLIGGLALVVFGILTLKEARTVTSSTRISQDSSGFKLESGPALKGFVTTISNPYLYVWWLTAGGALLLREYELGIIIAVAFVIGHWISDLIWFTVVSWSFSRGKFLLSQRVHKHILYACGAFLVVFGFTFMLNLTMSR